MSYAMRRWSVILTCVALTLSAVGAVGQDLEDFEKRMTEFTLDNGLRFLVMERHEAPVVSFQTYADVGSVDEVKGITGLAHLFEHMAFKGTKTVGTKDCEAEIKAMARLEATPENNLVPPMVEAAECYTTIGEVCDALREVWGEYREPGIF